MTRADVWPLAKRTFSEWSEDKASRLAAALALFTMLSLAPLLVITIKIVALALDDDVAQNEVKKSVQAYVGPAAGQAVQDMVAKAAEPGEGRWATVISSVLLVLGATALFASIQDALNTIWGVKPRPGQGIMATLRVRLRSLLLVACVAVLLLGSTVLSTFIHTLTDNLGGALVALSYVVDLLVSLAVTTALFALLFKFLPDVRLEWRDVWVGAAVTAVLFTLGKYALTLYFSKAAPASAYGAAGSLAALLIWVYYSGMIAFFGAEFTKVYLLHRGRPVVPRPHAVLLTPADRAAEGIPKTEQVEEAVAVDEAQREPVGRQPQQRPSAFARPGRVHPTSLALGAAATGLAALYLRKGKARAARRQAAALQLKDRINAVEAKVGRVSRVREYLDKADVAARIDRVDHETHRADRHVRAEKTGRPLWMVRLADLIGGRWSNL